MERRYGITIIGTGWESADLFHSTACFQNDPQYSPSPYLSIPASDSSRSKRDCVEIYFSECGYSSSRLCDEIGDDGKKLFV